MGKHNEWKITFDVNETPRLITQTKKINSHELLIVFALNYEKYIGKKCDFKTRRCETFLNRFYAVHKREH